MSFVKIPRHNIKSIMQLKCKIKHSALFNEEERTQKTPRSHQKNENGLNLKMIKCARRVKKIKAKPKIKK